MAGGGNPGNAAKVIIIKKKSKHAAHHGGAWKVAYADFVTAMMALFMVMWLLAQTDQSTRQKLSEYFRTGVFSGAPSVLNGGSGIQDRAFFDVIGQSSVESEQATMDRLALAIRAQITRASGEDADIKNISKNIQISVTEEGLLITILDGGEDLLFDLSSAELKPKLVSLLAKIAPILGRIENRLQIHGHTDGRPFPTGSRRSNWQLSFDRADKARAILEQNGLQPGQVGGVFAHADSALMNKEDPKAPENRRLSILAVRRFVQEAEQAKPAPSSQKAEPAPKRKRQKDAEDE